MSVLTLAGSGSLPLDYSRPQPAAAVRQSFDPNLGPINPTSTYTYTRPDKKTSTITTTEVPQSPIPSSHHHTRSNSSTAVPSPLPKPTRASYQPSASHSRQSSTSARMSNMSIQRQPTMASINSNYPRRSTSGRSTATNTPSSYVALMRKQKATVWCDRSQNIDPRVTAAQKAARQRAQLEVLSTANSAGSGRTSTLSSGGVAGKIRHGGVPKAPAYVPANMSGAGLPMRLSANEMLGDEEENKSFVSGDNAMVHGRSGSGKSSTGSANYRSGYPRADQGRFSTTSTPPSGNDGESPSGHDRIPEETPNAQEHNATGYFSSREKAGSADEDSFGDLKDLAGPSAKDQAMQNAKKAEDLRRRGSVDERAMSMGTGVKLFVANPDLDDD